MIKTIKTEGNLNNILMLLWCCRWRCNANVLECIWIRRLDIGNPNWNEILFMRAPTNFVHISLIILCSFDISNVWRLGFGSFTLNTCQKSEQNFLSGRRETFASPIFRSDDITTNGSTRKRVHKLHRSSVHLWNLTKSS